MSSNSFYRIILKDAFKVAWKHKFLWFFAFFAILFGNSGSVSIFTDSYKDVGAGLDYFEGLKEFYSRGFWADFWQNLGPFLSDVGIWFYASLALVVVSFVVLLWLSFSSQGSIFGGVYQLVHGEKVGFKKAFKLGTENFWKIFGVNIISNLIVIILGFLVVVPFSSAIGNDTLGAIGVILAFMVLIPVSIILSFVVKYAVIFIVSKNDGLLKSIQNAWLLFKANWLISLEMAVILFVTTILFGIVLIFAVGLLAIPFGGIAYIFYTLNMKVIFDAFLLVVGIFSIVTFMGLMLLFTTFSHNCWTLLFIKLEEEEKYIPKLARIFMKNEK
jgi:hypothetical protein